MFTLHIEHCLHMFFFQFSRIRTRNDDGMEIGIFVLSVLGHETQELVERRKWKTMRHLMRCMSSLFMYVGGYAGNTKTLLSSIINKKKNKYVWTFCHLLCTIFFLPA